jgi:hypothetical protein
MNLDDRSDEIRIKLRAAAIATADQHKLSSTGQNFQTKIVMEDPQTKLRLMTATLSDMPKIINFFGECMQAQQQHQPPTIILLEGYGDVFEAVVNKYRDSFKYKVCIYDEKVKQIEADVLYFADAKKMMRSIHNSYGDRLTSILCYGMTSRWVAREISLWRASQILMEDYGVKENAKNPLYGRVTDVVPATSFPYMSCCCFSSSKKKN